MHRKQIRDLFKKLHVNNTGYFPLCLSHKRGVIKGRFNTKKYRKTFFCINTHLSRGNQTMLKKKIKSHHNPQSVHYAESMHIALISPHEAKIVALYFYDGKRLRKEKKGLLSLYTPEEILQRCQRVLPLVGHMG